MNKSSKLIYVVNILLGLVLSFIYLFIINYSFINIFIYILLCGLYIVATIRYFKKNKKNNTFNFITLNIYLLFLMFMFIYNLINQSINNSYGFVYNNFYIYIFHILYILLNLFN